MEMSPENKHRAYIAEVDSHLEDTLKAGLEFIQWDKYIAANSTVFVKPNFTFPQYREGITTSPALLKHLLKLLKTRAGRIIMGESDGGNNSFRADEGFRGHGMVEVGRELGVELVNLSSIPSIVVEGEVLGRRVSVPLPRLLLEEIDCFITVPVLKVHAMTGVTLSLKNSWGCVPDSMRGMHHQNLSHKLALIGRSLKPRIVVIDGTYALDKHGPMYGEPVKTNLVVVADNTVAADALGTRLMGFAPDKIAHIAVAAKAGLGSTRLEDLELNQDWRKFRRQFSLERTFIDRISALHFNNDLLAKLIFQSPLTSAIYKVVPLMRTAKEKEIARQMGKQKKAGPY